MNNSVLKAKELIEQTAKSPKMYASCKESYVNRILSLLEMTDIKFSIEDFMKLSFESEGNIYLGVHDPIDDEWANKIAKSAIEICIKYKGLYSKVLKNE